MDEQQQVVYPGRQELPAHLPRLERVIACVPEQCQCQNSGRPITAIGYDQSEQLDVEPSRYLVVVTKREKHACPCCEQGGVVAAPASAHIIDKGLVSDRVVIEPVARTVRSCQAAVGQLSITHKSLGLAAVSGNRMNEQGAKTEMGGIASGVSATLRYSCHERGDSGSQ